MYQIQLLLLFHIHKLLLHQQFHLHQHHHHHQFILLQLYYQLISQEAFNKLFQDNHQLLLFQLFMFHQVFQLALLFQSQLIKSLLFHHHQALLLISALKLLMIMNSQHHQHHHHISELRFLQTLQHSDIQLLCLQYHHTVLNIS